jgi:hypothetical protein
LSIDKMKNDVQGSPIKEIIALNEKLDQNIQQIA